MKYNIFTEALNSSDSVKLEFKLPNGELIHPSYHITEIKKTTMQSIDCGKSVHEMFETIMQLYIPINQSDDQAMTRTKALGIMNKVDSKLRLHADSEVIIEFGKRGEAAARYQINEIQEGENVVRIGLKPFEVACKPALAFAESGSGQMSCC